MATENSPTIAQRLLDAGSVATHTLEILDTNVAELREDLGKQLRGRQVLFVPNTVLEEAGFPVPAARGQSVTHQGLEAHYAGPDDNNVLYSSFDLEQVQEANALEKLVRADLKRSKAYVVDLTEDGVVLMPPLSSPAVDLFLSQNLADSTFNRPSELLGQPPSVIHDALALERAEVPALLQRFPEITDLTGQGEISLQQLEQIEARRKAERGSSKA